VRWKQNFRVANCNPTRFLRHVRRRRASSHLKSSGSVSKCCPMVAVWTRISPRPPGLPMQANRHGMMLPSLQRKLNKKRATRRSARPVGKGGAQNLLLISNSSTGRSAARGIVPLGPDLQLSASIRPTCDGARRGLIAAASLAGFLPYDPRQHLLPAGPGVFGRANSQYKMDPPRPGENGRAGRFNHPTVWRDARSNGSPDQANTSGT